MLRNRLISLGSALLILWAATAFAQVGQPQAIPFSGKLVNTGSPIWQDPTTFISLVNLRHAAGGLETRNGVTYFTSNIAGDPIVALIPLQTDTEWHIVAATANPSLSQVSYYYIENGSFSSAEFLYKTNGTTATPISYCQVKDTLAIADAGGVTLWGGVSTYPTALLVENTAGIHADEYNYIYSGTTLIVTSGNTIHVGYPRPFDGLQPNANAAMDSVASSVTEYLQSGKMRYWSSYPVITGATGWISNGDFSGVTTGWTDTAGYQSGTTTGGVSGNCLEIVRVAVGSQYTYQLISGLEVGNLYTLSYYTTVGTAVATAMRVGSSYSNGSLYNSGFLFPATWTNYTANFTATATNAYVSMEINNASVTGCSAYFDSLQLTSGASTIYLPKIKSDPRELGTDWDGISWQFPKVFGFEKTGASPFQDYSTFLANSSQEEHADISQWTSGGTITMAWNYKPREIHVFLPEEFKNSVASTITAYYWNGTQYAAVPSVTDGTSYGSVTLARSGILNIPKLTDWKTRKVGENPLDLYSIILKVNTTISNYVRIYMVRAIPDYDSPSSVWMCRGVASAHNRLWLYNGRNKSHIYVSAENQPDCFTGDGSRDWIKPIVAGRQEDTVWLGPVGNYVLALKKTENWAVDGINPGTFKAAQMHGTIPCVSTGSVQVIERNGAIMAIYMARDGVYGIGRTSGGNENPLLSGDISAYWEPGNALEFSAIDIQNAQSWYSKTYQEYHLLVGLVELVYSPKFDRWTTFDRGTHALSSGLSMTDPNRNRIELGGGKDGRVYALESGTLDYTSAIVSDLTKPDSTLQDRLDKRNDLTGVALRYQRPDGTQLAGCSAYLTPSLASDVTTKEVGFTLAKGGWTSINLYDWRDADGTKGFTHKRRYRFPGQVKLFQEVIWSQETPWPN